MTDGSTPGHCARSIELDVSVAAPGASVVLGYEALRVRVAARDPMTLAWLEEFLCPSFERVPDGEADCLVTLVESGDEYRATRALGSAPGGVSAATFVLDRLVLSFPRWAGPAFTVHQDSAAVFYRVCAGGRAFVILAEPGNLAARVALMRAVRELAMGPAWDHGLLLHAAAAAVGRRVVVLAGPAAAGKTTLLVHLLRSGAARYVANDRAHVSLAGATPWARGMPTIVTIRPRTRELFADLTARLHERGYQHQRGLGERVPGQRLPLRLAPDGRANLSPAQFADALDVERVGEGELAAVVFPTITEAAEGLSVHRVPPAAAAERLLGCLSGPGLRPTRSEVFRLPGARSGPDEDVLRARCRRLAEAVPCFECRLGAVAYADPGSAAAVLALAR